MKRIVILGNSIAACAAIEEIRRQDKESEITFFSGEHYLPYQAHLFGDFLAKDVAEEKLFYRPKEFYGEQNVKVIADKEIARIDFKKNKIITEEKEQFPYDVLIISDSFAKRFPDIKGNNKMGIFGLRRLSDIKDLLAILHLVETVAVQSDTIEGLKVAYGLRKRNKDVIFIVKGPHVLSGKIEKSASEAIEDVLGKNGVRLIKENSLTEILGDSDVKAVRLKTGKVIAAQSVILHETRKDLRLFEDSGLKLEAGIVVDEYFATGCENVYAAGPVCQMAGRESWIFSRFTPFLEEQGRVAALNILGQKTALKEPLIEPSIQLFDSSVTLNADTKKEDGSTEIQTTAQAS